MVNYAANEVRNLLDAYPSVTDLTFSLSDGDLEGCQCSVCSSNHTDAAVKFLNDVVLKIQSLDGMKKGSLLFICLRIIIYVTLLR